jgi:hypothetical protein
LAVNALARAYIYTLQQDIIGFCMFMISTGGKAVGGGIIKTAFFL